MLAPAAVGKTPAKPLAPRRFGRKRAPGGAGCGVASERPTPAGRRWSAPQSRLPRHTTNRLAALHSRLLLDGALGRRHDLQPLVGDREPALDRPPVPAV